MPEGAGAERGQGMGGRVRRIVDALFSMVQSRFELASLELREEMYRWLAVWFLLAAGLFAGQLALLFLTLAVVAMFPEHLGLVLALAGGVYLAATVACIAALRRRLKGRPPPFSDTMAELKKDREWLNSLN
jgi:uncharacterized membrane protein YqjE